MSSDFVIEARGLVKDHFSNFLRKKSRALHGINLTVRRGEAFGLLGPNGAGKTTTQKLLLGLLRPTEGTVKVLGYDAGDPRALARIGFLPENPYFYSYLTAGEFLDFFGQLFGLSRDQRRERSEALLKMVSLSDAGDKPIRKFSKGMLQRLGIAQCLINDPELVFLDEPNSGLDPVGRRDIRNIIKQLKEQGKTIFLNSHLLPDVSELCDRVMILNYGRNVAEALTQDISSSGNYHDLEEYFMEAITRDDRGDERSKKLALEEVHLTSEGSTRATTPPVTFATPVKDTVPVSKPEDQPPQGVTAKQESGEVVAQGEGSETAATNTNDNSESSSIDDAKPQQEEASKK